MRFRLVEEILDEAHYRGETSLRQCLCDLINKFCGITLNHTDYVLHHFDGDHSNNAIDNLILLLKQTSNSNPNTSVHNNHRYGKFNIDRLDQNYISELRKHSAIDVYSSILNNKLTMI